METLVHSVARKSYHLLKNKLPAKYGDYVDLWLEKKIKVFDQALVNKTHLEMYPSARTVLKKDLIPTVLQAYYEKQDPNQILFEEGTKFIQSWVPFTSNQTGVFLYNFFDKNYSVRDPIFYRFVLFNENLKPVAIHSRILPALAVFYASSNEDLFPGASLPEQGTLVIQAFHPKAFVRKDQIRYFGVYHHPTKGVTCGVHAGRLALDGIVTSGPVGYRAIGNREGLLGRTMAKNTIALTKTIDCSGSNALARFSSPQKVSGVAFMTQQDAQGTITSIWHDGPTPHFVSTSDSPKKLGPCQTAFIVPQFETYAPVVLLDESQLGFKPGKTVFEIQQNGRTPISKTVDATGHTNFAVDLGQLFADEKITGVVSVRVVYDKDLGQFSRLPEGMAQIYYRSKTGWGDQLHSHHSYGFYNSPVKTPFNHRCVKYAPLIHDTNLRCVYSVVNVGGTKENPDQSVWVRILTDQGAEARFEVPVPYGKVTLLEGSDLLAKVDFKVSKAALVQLEHPSSNFNGSWHVLNNQLGTIASDHFTGG